MALRALIPEVMWPEHGADHSPNFIAEVSKCLDLFNDASNTLDQISRHDAEGAGHDII